MPQEFAQPLTQAMLRPPLAVPRWAIAVALLGLYLTLRGYHSRDGDQAYRLPLLLHAQTPSLYEGDPFVRAFDQFNPHRGALRVLDAASRPFGLSGGLFLLFVLTFLLTGLGVDRLARSTWPEAGPWVGLVAFALLLTAKAGNIGTNHLFEAMLLDRLQAFALGWVALASAVGSGMAVRVWAAPLALGMATLIHPSAGLQLAMISSAAWMAWAVAGRWTGVAWSRAAANAMALGLSVVPGLLLNGGKPGVLLGGLPPEDYWTLAVELQSPQHMLPHLWRMPQWLAWGSYPLLAGLALFGHKRASLPDRTRLVLMLGVTLAGLALAWVGIEVVRDVRLTVFQPFRMATIARGLCIVLISGRLMELWREGVALSRLRAAVLVVGLTGDWLLVVATAVELTAWGIGFVRAKHEVALQWAAVGLTLAVGLRFLSRHDTESGHLPLLMTLAAMGLMLWTRVGPKLCERTQNWLRSRKMVSIAVGSCWVVPVLAILAGLIPASHPLAGRPVVHALIARCRFFETPADDVERLAAWCRANTAEDARFVGPPGPKTFRLWSRRTLAFNRSASPYHAEGLADWFARFRDHVGFDGSAEEFVRQYVRNRHGIESRYQAMDLTERTQLAVRQGADHVIAAAPSEGERPDGEEPLELLHAEGRYAVYRVRAAESSNQFVKSVPGNQLHR